MTYRVDSTIVNKPLKHIMQKSSNNRSSSSLKHLSSIPQYLRIECKAEEKHLTSNILSNPFTLNSFIEPIKFTLYDQDQLKPIHYKSEIVLHNNPDTNLRIKVLRVAFHNCSRTQSMNPSMYRSRERKPLISNNNDLSSKIRQDNTKSTKRRSITSNHSSSRSRSKVALHQWIDDICKNNGLMYNDDIVFFLKHGEFYVRI